MYNDNHIKIFISKNFNKLKTLSKFQYCNTEIDIYKKMSLKSSEVLDFIKSNKTILYDVNQLKLIRINNTECNINQLNNLKSTLKSNSKPSEFEQINFFEFFTGSIFNKYRDIIPMSFSICNNDNRILNLNNKDNIIAYQNHLLSFSPVYMKNKNSISIIRVNYFTNKIPIRLLDYQTHNYTGRYLFRQDFTQLILGFDYNFDIIESETFIDGTLGQEVYYNLINNYEVDRIKNLYNGYNYFQSKYNKKSINEYFKDVFYFYDSRNKNNGFNGVIYFDHTIYDNKDYPGIECLIPYYSHYLDYQGSYLVNNDMYYKKEKTYDFIDDSIKCINENLYKNNIEKSICYFFNY